jgi:hypothetical protein
MNKYEVSKHSSLQQKIANQIVETIHSSSSHAKAYTRHMGDRLTRKTKE